MSSLRANSISGVFWALIEKSGVTIVKFILGIILARLLTPEDFGLIGMITVFITIAQVLVDNGFGMAYIQKKEVNNADADTVFFTNMIISVVLFIVIYFLAPLIANFYKQPELIILTRVLAMVIIINAFNVIQRAQFIREVNFQKLTKVTLISSLLAGTIGIVAAYKGMGVWALVVNSLCNRTFIGIGFCYLSDYRPGRGFSNHSFKEMFSFGSWMLFSNLINTLFNNIYVLAIGKFFPVAQLGFYAKSKQLAEISTNQIAQTIGNVAFPVYSKLQGEKERLYKAMQKFIQHTMLIIVLIIAILIIIAKPLIILLLTEKWAPMIPYFQVICFTAILYPMNQINAQSLIALGKSKLIFNLTFVRNFLRLINIYVTFRFGVIHMLIGEMLIAIVFFFINARIIGKYTEYGIYRQFKDIWRILVGGIIASSIAALVITFIDNLFIWLIIGILITGIVYLFMEYFLNRNLLKSLINIITTLKQNRIITTSDDNHNNN